MTPRIAYVRADVVQTPSADLPSSSTGTYSTGSMPVTDSAPPDVAYSGASGCGCGGGQSPDGSGSCRTCGGWQPGTCSTHDPNGSCFLQRLSCCLCKPYPDCSNGCVDFCHSWIFHEDDCWLFSNHKCCNAGCGPYPYGTCATDGQGQGNSCGCNCGCGPCVPPPDLYFTAGALVLTRDNESRSQTVVENTTLSTTALSTSDFDFDWIAGPSFVLGYRPTKMDAWELSYFGMHDWNSEQTVDGAADLSLPGSLGTLSNFTGASTVQVDYNSQIDDAELNYYWHHDNPNLMWMIGFRYFHLDEKFDILSTVTGTGSSAYDIRTDNDMAGGQIGLRLKHCCSWFECDVTAKAGAFGNSAGQSQIAFDVDSSNPPLRSAAGVHDGNWAFLGDLGSNVSIYLCPNWCVMGGYNLMWVDGVALAPDQLDFNGTGNVLDRNGKIFYQGAHLALGCRW